MKKNILFKITVLFIFTTCTMFITCKDDECVTPPDEDTIHDPVPVHGHALGLKIGNTQNTERDVMFLNGGSMFSENLPPSVDLSMYLPPIGDQGQYGTCTAWAIGYNLRTGMYAKLKKLDSYSLQKESNQFSPRDLFVAIDDNDKGRDCDGAFLTAALDVLVDRGCAKMSIAPYSGFTGGCGLKPQDDWTTQAANYKIKNYRAISKNVQTIKSYLNQGQMVVFGAFIGDGFDNYTKNSNPLSEQTYYRGAHALICCGYDDSKHAFRIANSWGSRWGDNGFIWIDYDFFCSTGNNYGVNQFVIDAIINNVTVPELYVAYNLDDTDINDDDEVINPESGYDLVAYSLTDEDYDEPFDSDAADPTWRTATYSVYNVGTETISSSKNWVIALMYYNAYDAADNGIILLDYYTDKKGSKGQFNDKWDADEAKKMLSIQSAGYAWSNVDVHGGESVSHAVYNRKEKFSWTYQMPKKLNGEYYLVLYADAFRMVEESNKENNYYYWAQADGKPITYKNGVPQTSLKKMHRIDPKLDNTTPHQNQNTDFQSVVTPHNANAYTTAEISALINYQRKSGELQKKALQWIKDSGNTTKGRK